MVIQPLKKAKFLEQMERAEKAPDISLDAIERYWNWAYGQTDGAVQTCAFPVPTEDKSPDEMGSGHWIHARTLEEFKEFCNTYSGMWRYHIYAGVNTLNKIPEVGRGGAKHIDTVNHLSFDIELERESYGGSSKEEVWWCYQYALAQAKFMNEEYNVWPMIVMSENGIHMHYKVRFPTDDKLMHGQSHKYTKWMTQQSMSCDYAKSIEKKAPDSIEFGQDDVSDIPRVMKVPGTRGIKSENGRLCGIIHKPSIMEAGTITKDQVQVPDDAFEDEKRERESNDETVKEVEVTPEDASTKVMTRVKSLCKKEPLFRRMFEGNTSDYSSRSEAEMGFAMKMLNHGFDPDEMNQIFWASGMSKWDEESDNYRERTIEKAVEGFDGNEVKDSTNGSFTFSRH